MSQAFPIDIEAILKPADARRHEAALSQLQAGFTVDQNRRQGGYLRHPPAIAAYGVFYGLRTATKVFQLLQELQPQARTVLDLGAGTLGASLGALSALDDLEEVSAIDRSRKALDWGGLRLKELRPHLKLRSFAGDLLSPKTRFYPADLVIAANLLDELRREPDRQRLFRRMMKALNPGGMLLLVEPGTRRASHRLIRIREAVKDELAILGPCRGATTCPYADQPKEGWCFSEWEPDEPAWYRKLRTAAGIRRSRLTWSWLALQKEGPSPRSGARVVSGAMEAGRYLCTSKGRVLVRSATPTWQRGALLTDWQPGGSS